MASVGATLSDYARAAARHSREPSTSNWFHVPIATPVIIAGTRAKLVQVFVMFRCGSAASIAANDATIAGCNITEVDVWDGASQIHKFGPFLLFGEHRFRLGTSNTFKLPTPPSVVFGIELAVHVSFSQNEPITLPLPARTSTSERAVAAAGGQTGLPL